MLLSAAMKRKAADGAVVKEVRVGRTSTTAALCFKDHRVRDVYTRSGRILLVDWTAVCVQELDDGGIRDGTEKRITKLLHQFVVDKDERIHELCLLGWVKIGREASKPQKHGCGEVANFIGTIHILDLDDLHYLLDEFNLAAIHKGCDGIVVDNGELLSGGRTDDHVVHRTHAIIRVVWILVQLELAMKIVIVGARLQSGQGSKTQTLVKEIRIPTTTTAPAANTKQKHGGTKQEGRHGGGRVGVVLVQHLKVPSVVGNVGFHKVDIDDFPKEKVASLVVDRVQGVVGGPETVFQVPDLLRGSCPITYDEVYKDVSEQIRELFFTRHVLHLHDLLIAQKTNRGNGRIRD